MAIGIALAPFTIMLPRVTSPFQAQMVKYKRDMKWCSVLPITVNRKLLVYSYVCLFRFLMVAWGGMTASTIEVNKHLAYS
jgi:hypothetical protein